MGQNKLCVYDNWSALRSHSHHFHYALGDLRRSTFHYTSYPVAYSSFTVGLGLAALHREGTALPQHVL